MHLGDKLLIPKLHFDITIQSENLLSDVICREISRRVDDLILSKHFKANRDLIAVNVWLIIHPLKIVFAF